jgi:uncharacterized protein YbaR (Trm112 family)
MVTALSYASRNAFEQALACEARRHPTLERQCRMQEPLMDDAMLRLLVCPACHAALTMPSADSLLCTGCGRRYPVRDGLPVLIAVAAQV